MADLDTTSMLVGAVSLERQYLALALRAVAAAARGEIEVAEQAMGNLTVRAALLVAPPPRSSFLRLIHSR